MFSIMKMGLMLYYEKGKWDLPIAFKVKNIYLSKAKVIAGQRSALVNNSSYRMSDFHSHSLCIF